MVLGKWWLGEVWSCVRAAHVERLQRVGLEVLWEKGERQKIARAKV
jgi:hypothetical protein